MSANPINLGLRFLLEMVALFSFGVWGWQKGDGWLRFVLAAAIPLFFAALWGTFRVPNDPGAAPVAVAGVLRLGLEMAFFSLAALALADARLTTLSWVFGGLAALHYLVSYDRILWLVRQ
jgi:hypothetical protein